MYADMTTKNKSLLKRYSHGSRFKISVALLKPESNDRILDYGTGDGFMLSRLREKNNHCRIVGYEPVPYMFKELQVKMHEDINNKNIEIENDVSDYINSFNKICCLEVLEHLLEELVIEEIEEIEEMIRLLTDDGQLIISVPIEVGASSLFKNIARLLLRQTHGNTTFRTILYSLFGIKFNRGDDAYISSHIGFYYHDLEKILLSSGLKLKNKLFSPVPILGALINSQVFFVLEKG